jgi:hypothetical protein
MCLRIVKCLSVINPETARSPKVPFGHSTLKITNNKTAFRKIYFPIMDSFFLFCADVWAFNRNFATLNTGAE